MKSPKRLRRRVVLSGLVTLFAAIGFARSASADEEVKEADKIPKAEAKYQDHPHGQQRCEICLQFVPPNKCKIVQGPIVAKGWCQYFAAKENAH